MPVKAVIYGLLIETDEHKQQLSDGFQQLHFQSPKILHQFKTLPGKGGEGGRNDVLVEFADCDIPRLAVHPFHLNGMFSWLDDYVVNNREIIPESSYEALSICPNFEPRKPECKLVGANGNVFNIIALVTTALERAGQKDLAKEFQENAFKSESYDAVLTLTHDYVDVV